MDFRNQILVGDVVARLRELPDGCVHTVVTSPPYWGLRNYGVEGQLGLEATPDAFVAKMVEVFREVRRVLRDDGTLWLNIGDSYAGSWGAQGQSGQMADRSIIQARHVIPNPVKAERTGSIPEGCGLKPKDLVMMPARLALALQADGWWVRMDCIWAKPNPMPESVTDRPTKAHEYVFLLSKSERYFYDAEAVREKSTGFAHSRGNGVNPKSGLPPSGWDKSVGQGGHGTIHKNPRQNESFSKAISGVVLESRNMRSVWTIPTEAFPEAHFATFPQKLVEPCILAGTSEGGCCSKCGTPYKREVEVQYENPGNRQTNGDRSKDRKHLEHGSAGYDVRLERRSTTVGWKKSCDCSDWFKTSPAVVLDPFMGSGTTALVALRARRDFVGVELNPAYAEMARKRIEPELSQLKLC